MLSPSHRGILTGPTPQSPCLISGPTRECDFLSDGPPAASRFFCFLSTVGRPRADVYAQTAEAGKGAPFSKGPQTGFYSTPGVPNTFLHGPPGGLRSAALETLALGLLTTLLRPAGPPQLRQTGNSDPASRCFRNWLYSGGTNRHKHTKHRKCVKIKEIIERGGMRKSGKINEIIGIP